MTCTDTERVAWALLARAAAGPCAPLVDLVHRVGVTEAAAAIQTGDVSVAMPSAILGRAGDFDTAARDLDRIQGIGGRLVTPYDDEWPRELLSCLPTGSENPGDVAPLALWARGSGSLREITARAIAVTGARASTDYGNQVARSLSIELADVGWTVLSGAAFGIDGIAHRGALAVGGATVAIMPCGIERAYPVAHEALLDNIAEHGLIVSEYPPGTRVHRYAFLDRNRLIAALSAGVVVVEAGLRSGTASTVRWAQRMGRPVFAIPGPVTSAASQGCHGYIADGDALLATCAEDILRTLEHRSVESPTPAPQARLGADGVIR